MAISYIIGGELPDVAVTWTDEQTGLIDFSTGWTFTVRVGKKNETALITKTTGMVGAATAPNLTIAWAPDQLDALDPGTYDVDVEARHTASGKDRKRSFQITMEAQVLP